MVNIQTASLKVLSTLDICTRSRYIYEMFYLKKEITRDLYEFCL